MTGVPSLRRAFCAVLVVLALLALSGCAAGPGGRWAAPESEAAGIFVGLWHGILLLVTLVVSFFTDDVRIYELNNTGIAYDIGFVLGVLAVYGNGVHLRASRKKSRSRDRDDLEDAVERRICAKVSGWLEDEEDWKDIGEKLEKKIKDRLRRWLEEEKGDSERA